MATSTMSFAAQIRSQFPLLKRSIHGQDLVYLDNAATSQKPQRVIDAISHYYSHYNANIHRGVHAVAQEATEAYENARTSLASYMNAASPREIIFTSGTTASMNLAAQSWGKKHLKTGDVILISRMDHHSNIVPWQMIAEEKGARIEVIEINRKGEILMDAFARQLDSLPVKLVTFPHVSNALGTINPVKEMTRLAQTSGALVCVDGAQSMPHLKVDLQDLGVDFYASSAHKMYGPTGMGLLYGKEALLEDIPPWQGGGEMIQTVTFEKTTYNSLPHKFEAGTPNIAGAVGFAEALRFIEESGIEEIAAWENHLVDLTTDAFSDIEGLTIYGQAEKKASVVSFLVDGVHPYDLGTLLDQQGVAVRTGHHCTEPLMDWFQIPGTVRASFAAYNTEEDVERLTAALKKSVNMLR